MKNTNNMREGEPTNSGGDQLVKIKMLTAAALETGREVYKKLKSIEDSIEAIAAEINRQSAKPPGG